MSFEDAFERGERRAREALAAAGLGDTRKEDVVTALDAYTVEQAALDGHDAGLCVIRASTDGTKAPLGAWKRWQTEMPTRDQIAAWFDSGHAGIGVVTGQISGNLELLEFEGRAAADGTVTRFRDTLYAAGLRDEWQRIAHGYSEETPSGGFHVLWRCEQIGGNQKLARRANPTTGEIEVLIETRGEGGFVICAPSNGTTHPSGRPWKRLRGSFATIATVHPELRERILGIARSFDELPDTEPERTKPVGEKGDGGTLPGFDRTIDEVLGDAGFTVHHTDRQGNQHWTRPGKDVTEGSSLTVWGDDGRATPWSTSIDMPGEFLTGKRLLTAWQLHVALNHRGDFTKAGREWAEAHGQAPDLTVIDLPADFWDRRPLLGHVEQFARARRCSPWAVLGVTLTRLAAAIPPFVALPPLVGGHLSLNLFLNLVGPSGAGKDAAAEAGRQALDVGAIKTVGLGSGEGILDQYVVWRPPDPKNDDPGGIEQHTKAVLFTAPEIESLGALRGRSSATLMPELRKAWMGSALGFAYANRERRLFLDPHTYRLCLIVGVQPDHADILLSEAAGGTPQRFLWMPATDPHAPDVAPSEPEPLPFWRLPKWPAMVQGFVTLEVCETARRMVDEARIARLRGEGDALDGHALACRLKVAAILGIADGRPEVSDDDWDLAGLIQMVSDHTRASAAAAVGELSKRSNRARGEARAEQEIIVSQRIRDHDQEVLERIAGFVLDRLSEEWMPRSKVRGSLASRDRDRFDEVVAALLEAGRIEADETEYKGQKALKYRLARGGH